jgi:plastocyanin
MKKACVLLVAIALALFGLAACGDDDDDDASGETTPAETTTEATGDTGGAGTTLDITAAANGDLAYDQTELTAPSGLISVNFDNPASLEHDVVIEDDGGAEIAKTDLVADGQVTTSAEIQPGTYTYYCSVPGHREGGMEGTLTVN